MESPPVIEGRCNALLDHGTRRCRRYAGAGTEHKGVGACLFHFGRTESANKASARLIAEAKQAELTGKLLDRLGRGGPVPDVDLAGMWAVNLDIGQQLVEWFRDDVLPEAGALDAAAPSVWLERLAKQVSEQLGALRLASQTGLEERQQLLREDQAHQVAELLRLTFDDAELGLSEAQRDALPTVLRRARERLRLVETTAIDVPGEPKHSDQEGGQ